MAEAREQLGTAHAVLVDSQAAAQKARAIAALCADRECSSASEGFDGFVLTMRGPTRNVLVSGAFDKVASPWSAWAM